MFPLSETCFHYRKLLSDNGNIWLSIIGNISQFKPISQSEAHDLPVADFPYSSSGIPLAACRFHPALQFNFFQPHTKSNDLVVRDCFGRRLPEGFFDDEFDCFEAFALFGVVTITHTDCVTRRSIMPPHDLSNCFTDAYATPVSLLRSSAYRVVRHRRSQPANKSPCAPVIFTREEVWKGQRQAMAHAGIKHPSDRI